MVSTLRKKASTTCPSPSSSTFSTSPDQTRTRECYSGSSVTSCANGRLPIITARSSTGQNVMTYQSLPSTSMRLFRGPSMQAFIAAPAGKDFPTGIRGNRIFPIAKSMNHEKTSRSGMPTESCAIRAASALASRTTWAPYNERALWSIEESTAKRGAITLPFCRRRLISCRDTTARIWTGVCHPRCACEFAT